LFTLKFPSIFNMPLLLETFMIIYFQKITEAQLFLSM
jgi:hypothetical protein